MAAEYNGKNAPGVSFPVLPRPLKKQRRRWRAQVETGDPTGVRSADPTKSFWHGGDRDEGSQLATRVLQKEALDKAIDEAWY